VFYEFNETIAKIASFEIKDYIVRIKKQNVENLLINLLRGKNNKKGVL